MKLTLEHFWATPRIPDRLMGDDDIYFAWYMSGCSNNHNGDSIEITMNGETDTIDLSTPGKALKLSVASNDGLVSVASNDVLVSVASND